MWFYFDYVLCIWTHGFVSIAGSYNTNEKPFLMDQHNITKLMFQNLLSNDKKVTSSCIGECGMFTPCNVADRGQCFRRNLLPLSTLMVEADNFSEMLKPIYQKKQHHIPGESFLLNPSMLSTMSWPIYMTSLQVDFDKVSFPKVSIFLSPMNP